MKQKKSFNIEQRLEKFKSYSKYVDRNRRSEEAAFNSKILKAAFSGCPFSYRSMLYVIRNEFGFEKLRNADVLEFGANRQPFCHFLKKKFGTKTVSSNRLSQDINHLFPNKRFDLIIGNKVFEREAFEHKTGQSDEALEEPIDEFLKQMPRKLLRKERAWVRAERTAILKRIADHLKPGGKIIATAIPSKTIFHPDEISRAGLKILELNVPTYGALATVLYKPR